ncbi:MAG: response regulator [Chloroflexi bacterium]|nr:response regulator [Chloroflexota bacterium]
MEPKKIILMEDDPDIAWLTQWQLERAGYRVHAANDGRRGLNEFLDAGADLLLIDIDLPGLNGWEVCTRVRAISRVPIIMLTAYPQKAGAIPPAGRRCERVIEKPFTFATLLAGIADSLAAEPRGAEGVRRR